MKESTNYWFTIEPYVHVRIVENSALLYNTLDGSTFELKELGPLELLRNTLQKENCGVSLLTSEKYKQKDISDFIDTLRQKYMGDVIDVALSKVKPVQIMPYFNLSNEWDLYKKQSFSEYSNILKNLSEISIYVDNNTNLKNLISFLHSVPKNLNFTVIGDLREVINYEEFLSILNDFDAPKNIQCSYKSIMHLQPNYCNNFSYVISVDLPIDETKWNSSRHILLDQAVPHRYVFEVSSNEDYMQAEQLIEKYNIVNYQIIPIYHGDNIDFFKESVFLTKEDILSGPVSIKDIFSNQALNVYDFGKINILPNGDVYANTRHPVLGNITTHSIHEIVYKEIDEGRSWFRVRNQAPCTTCIYQWLCPSPSNYEIAIGKPNLCHIKQE